jgi:hypothetical protein
MAVYLNEKKKMAKNKLHHKIPNLFRFVFLFLDPGYLKLIQNEKRISCVGLQFPKIQKAQYFKIFSWTPRKSGNFYFFYGISLQRPSD